MKNEELSYWLSDLVTQWLGDSVTQLLSDSVTLTSSSFIVNNFLNIYQNYVMYDISFNNNFASQNK